MRISISFELDDGMTTKRIVREVPQALLTNAKTPAWEIMNTGTEMLAELLEKTTRDELLNRS